MVDINDIAIGVLSGAIASFITSNIALRKFYKEKWWEKKYEVYKLLLTALYEHKKNINTIKRHLDAQLNGYCKKIEEESYKSKISVSLEEVIFSSSFILDNEISDVINEFIERSRRHYKSLTHPESGSDPSDFIDWYDKDIECIDLLLLKIVPMINRILKNKKLYLGIIG